MRDRQAARSATMRPSMPSQVRSELLQPGHVHGPRVLETAARETTWPPLGRHRIGEGWCEHRQRVSLFRRPLGSRTSCASRPAPSVALRMVHRQRVAVHRRERTQVREAAPAQRRHRPGRIAERSTLRGASGAGMGAPFEFENAGIHQLGEEGHLGPCARRAVRPGAGVNRTEDRLVQTRPRPNAQSPSST